MSQTSVDLLIGCGTLFLTTVTNIGLLGFFLGGLKTKVENLRLDVAELRGLFVLVPKPRKDQ